ncbi:hypothetical protein M422DRAFT_84296, partial [Sphaerobolus stellatus SS14]
KEKKSDFVRQLGERAVIKDRNITLLVEFVPLTFDTEKTENIAVVENDSRLPVGAIVSARWIKPENRRKEGHAHLIVRVSGAEVANKILWEGMVIKGKRVRGRKMAREPRRCLKCQRMEVPHIATSCMSVKETCGESHHTKECQETNPAKYKCANCNIHGHAAWSRECPAYQRAASKIRRRDTEATYKYILTGEPWTW